MKQKVNYFFSVLMSLLMLGINCPVMVLADTGQDQSLITTEITHSPVEEAKAGKRISLEVTVEDKAGIEVIRVYFKAIEGAEYNFIVLSGQGGEYSGSLPAPANGVGGIDYLVLVKNGNNKVVKSQTYRITVKDDDNAGQSIADNDKINVYTELQNPPSEITGFSDNIAVDVVESAAKLGVVAGLYSTTVAGASTGAATAGGTVTASAGGLSTTTIVVGSVAAAAVVGGVAAGSGGGGDGGGESSEGSGIVGVWRETSNSMSGWDRENWTFNSSGTLTWAEYEGTMMSGDGIYTVSGNNVVVEHSYANRVGFKFNCTMSGNSMSCSYEYGSNTLIKL